MKSRQRSISQIAFAFFVASIAASHAEYVTNSTAGGWKGGAYVDDKSKDFVFCDHEIKFGNGASIVLLLNARLEPLMYLTDSRLTVAAQEKVTVQADFEGVTPASVELQGNATSKNTLRLKLPPLPDHFEILRMASHITLTAPGIKTRFDLKGIAEALPATIECTIAQRAKQANPREPYGMEGFSPLQREIQFATLAMASRLFERKIMIARDNIRKKDPNALMLWADVSSPPSHSSIVYYLPPAIGTTIADAEKNFETAMKNQSASGWTITRLPSSNTVFGLSGQNGPEQEQTYVKHLSPTKGFIIIKNFYKQNLPQDRIDEISQKYMSALEELTIK